MTLRVGEAAKVAMPDGRDILIACDTAGADASFQITAWKGLTLRRGFPREVIVFERAERFVRMRLHERIELSVVVALGGGLEVYVSNLEADRVTVSLDAPREWKISRVLAHDAA